MKTFAPFQATLIIAAGILLSTTHVNAQSLVYSDDFETDNTFNWLINLGFGDNVADFYFDYTSVGIPVAPHSTSGGTRGLKLQANVNPATQDGILAGYGLSVSPLGFSITENFEMRFDMWMNYVPVASGNTATYIGGAGFGTAGFAAQRAMPSPGVVDSIFIGASTDGNTAADYRVYSPQFYTGLQDASGVYAAGSRNNTANYYVTNFPGGTAPPEAQTNLYPSQTSVRTPNGTIGFKWRDVSLKKVANIITYRIDDVLIATIDATTNGALGGANILFNCYDINGNASIDPLAPTLLFALFDNLRITNFPSVVSVTPTVPDASEAGPTPGTFTITRTEPGPAITVYYTLSGTATNGQDYVSLPGSVTLPNSATEVNIPLTPIDDAISEFAETVTLSVLDSTNYVGAGTATINIADNDTPTFDIALVQSTMYERIPEDRVRFRLTRRGDLTVANNVNLSYTGAAAPSRHTAPSPVSVNFGDVTTEFDVNPVNDSLFQGDQTIICTVAPGSGYAVGTTPSATATIVDDEVAPETVLFSDNFNTDTSANWTLRYASNFEGDNDFMTTFNYDYTFFPYGAIPPAPHSGTDTHGLYLQVNKFDGTEAAAALNLYPVGQTFSGNFALRFDMFLIAPASGTTEYALFGVNHSGNQTNWFRNSAGGVPAGWTFDGLFYGVETDAAALGDYALYSSSSSTTNPAVLNSRTAASLTGTFKVPPFARAGAPANTAVTIGQTPTWADVEISQVGDLVTLKINNTVIFTYTNTTAFTSGNVMLGTCDAYDSLGAFEGGVIYDNVRVVRLATTSRPDITHIQITGSNVEIFFTGETSDTPSAFALQEASTVNGTYANVTAAITGSAGNFKAERAVTAGPRFFRIKRQ